MIPFEYFRWICVFFIQRIMTVIHVKGIEKATQNLFGRKAKIDEDKVGQASFLMVISGGQYAYCRNVGILIEPIGCIKN